jgi:hypothetical protein
MSYRRHYDALTCDSTGCPPPATWEQGAAPHRRLRAASRTPSRGAPHTIRLQFQSDKNWADQGKMVDVFIHIPKTAGTTLRTVLARQYGLQNILYFEPGGPSWDPSVSEKEYIEKAQAAGQPALITGHHAFGIHHLLKSPCRYFSMMRDPIDRVISEFYYAFVFEEHIHGEEIRSGRLTLEQFIEDPTLAPRHGQAELLAGFFSSRGGVVSTAIANVENCFTSVGTTERFDESVLQIAKSLGWGPPLYLERNVTRLDEKTVEERERLRADLRAQYAEKFKDEYDLHRVINNTITQRASSEGIPFAKALQAYREIQLDVARTFTDDIHQRYELRADDLLPDYFHRYVGSTAYNDITNYLNSPNLPFRKPRNYFGILEEVDKGSITGWAADLCSSEPLTVSVLYGNETIAVERCEIWREDVVTDGYAIGPCGFRVYLSDLFDDPGMLKVCFEDTPIELKRL